MWPLPLSRLSSFDLTFGLRRLYDTTVDGLLVASDWEGISKGVKSCRADSRWSYVGGAPNEALDQIAEMADRLYEIYCAVSKHGGVAPSLVFMPSHQTWGKGTGLKKAYERYTRQLQRKVLEICNRLDRAFSTELLKVHVIYDPSPVNKKGIWPNNDVCLLAECEAYQQFVEWLARNAAALRSESKNLSSLMVAPLLKKQAIAPYALHITSSIGVMPAPEFASRWGDKIGFPLHSGAALQAFEEAFSNMLFILCDTRIVGWKAFA